MNKKVGIITLPLIDNYGGLIQRAALYHFIKKNGCTPVIIDREYDQSKVKAFIKNRLASNPFYKIFDYHDLTKWRNSLKKIDTFVSLFFENRTKKIYNNKDLKRAVQKLDTVIVGSDQVWRYKYVKSGFGNYFLDFTEPHQKRIAYAASFGVDIWEGDDASVSRVKELLTKFDAVSVREDVGVGMCSAIFEYEHAVQVLDPTLLLDVSFYDLIISREDIRKQVPLFNYVLDASSKKREIMKQISDTLHLDITTIDLQEDIKDQKMKPSISEWLYHFKSASYVVTDSFHGMVFAIIFNKQFIAIGNKARGMSRFTSLLGQLGLEARLISEDDRSYVAELLQIRIDYEAVNGKLEKLKQQSAKFLLDQI